ncbi:MAG: hypothetical protein CSB46_05530 [Micrococcales bacterium]|nr:MAG: hypothetical protein CSB46_05530 [Micrococcales bacterium]
MMLIDLVYPVVYAAALVLALRWAVARAGYPRWLRGATLVPAAAAVLDYVENIGLIRQLWGRQAGEGWAAVAFVAAAGKFALIGVAIAGVLALAVLSRVPRRRRPG